MGLHDQVRSYDFKPEEILRVGRRNQLNCMLRSWLWKWRKGWQPKKEVSLREREKTKNSTRESDVPLNCKDNILLFDGWRQIRDRRVEYQKSQRTATSHQTDPTNEHSSAQTVSSGNVPFFLYRFKTFKLTNIYMHSISFLDFFFKFTFIFF